MVKLKGELLLVQQMVITWEDPVISVSKLVGHFILLDLYDISLLFKNLFSQGYEGSVSNCTEVLNGPVDSAAMLTWYQGNFTEVLNRLAGSEAMPG